MPSLSHQLAQVCLEIPTLQISLDKPFLWASGYRMPVYNDTRLLLANFQHRALVTQALAEIISEKKIHADLISGTTTAGIAPAVSLAEHLCLPLTILTNNESYVFQQEDINNFITSSYGEVKPKEYDLIVSTAPFGIIPGIVLANRYQLPFAYVREKAKTHGKQQRLEGIVKSGQRAVLIDWYEGRKSYAPQALDFLQEQGIFVINYKSANLPRKIKRRSICGKNLLKIEDTLSFGGSALQEIWQERKQSAVVTDGLAVFSYDFPETRVAFEQAGCQLHAALRYDVLFHIGLEQGFISQEQAEKLIGWQMNPLQWGKEK